MTFNYDIKHQCSQNMRDQVTINIM